MSGKWILDLPQAHSCARPEALAIGSIWQCDCGQSYRWTSDDWGNYWNPVSERQVRRALKRANV